MKKILLAFFALMLSVGALFTTQPLTVQPCQAGVSYGFSLSQPSFLSTDLQFAHFLPSFSNGSGSLVFDVPCNASGVYQFSLNAWNSYFNQTDTTQVFVSSPVNSTLNVFNPPVSCVCSESKSVISGGGSVSVQSQFQNWLSPDNSTLIQQIPCSTKPGLYLFKVFSNSKEYDYALDVADCSYTSLKTPSLAQTCVGSFSAALTLSNNYNSDSTFSIVSNMGSVLSPIEHAPFASRSFIYTVFLSNPGVYTVQINVSASDGLNSQSNFIINASSCSPRVLNLSASGVLSGGVASVTIQNNENFDVTGMVFQLNKTLSKATAIPSGKSVIVSFPFNSSTALISGYSIQGVFNQTVVLSNSSSVFTGFVTALPFVAGGVVFIILLMAAAVFLMSRREKTDEELLEEAKKEVEGV
jgi:hypothetical protein